MESISLPTGQGWRTSGCQSAMPRQRGRESRGLMCPCFLNIHRVFHSWDLERRASCPCSSHSNAKPVSSKMAGKDEGCELHGIFQSPMK